MMTVIMMTAGKCGDIVSSHFEYVNAPPAAKNKKEDDQLIK